MWKSTNFTNGLQVDSQPSCIWIEMRTKGKSFFFAFSVLIDPIPADVYRYLTFLRLAAASNHNHDTCWMAGFLLVLRRSVRCSENSSLSPPPRPSPRIFSAKDRHMVFRVLTWKALSWINKKIWGMRKWTQEAPRGSLNHWYQARVRFSIGLVDHSEYIVRCRDMLTTKTESKVLGQYAAMSYRNIQGEKRCAVLYSGGNCGLDLWWSPIIVKSLLRAKASVHTYHWHIICRSCVDMLWNIGFCAVVMW